jgi:HD-GYP domain-containing protein (c-di-GMP phosphodiesterase class II)
LAGLLLDIGTIGYPDQMINKSDGDMDNVECALWQKHPLLGEANIKGIERLKQVSLIIRSHHERFDGKGFPEGLRADQIPLLARIVAVADYFDGLINRPATKYWLSAQEAIENLEKEKGTRFDPSVVYALIDTTEKDGKSVTPGEAEIHLDGLAEGMILARDLKTRGGILLLPAGNRIQAMHLEKILNFHRIDPIVDRIFVLRMP